MITSVTVKTTRKNEKMAFVNVEDRFGEIECIVFVSQYQKFAHLLRTDNAVFISGSISIRDDERPKIIVSSISQLIENNRFTPPAKDSKTVDVGRIFLRVPDMNGEKYQRSLSAVNKFHGKTQVVFYDTENKKYNVYKQGVDLCDSLLSALYQILGTENVVLK